MPHIDPQVLAELRSLQTPDDAEFVASLLTLFLDALTGGLERIDRHLGGSDAAALKLEAHAMKSSSLNAGAKQLAALCQKLEDATSPEESRALVEKLRAEVRDVISEVNGLPEFAGKRMGSDVA